VTEDEIKERAAENGKTRAFPCDNFDGMTMREWLAALALQGILANQESYGPRSLNTPKQRAVAAVQHADALLIELERKP
jgi:hypothetical protein